MSVIRLNRLIARSRRHRWLFVIVVLLLAVLLAFVALHSLNDAAAAPEGGLVCAFVVLFVVSVLLVAQLAATQPPSRQTSRGPPSQRPAARPPVRQSLPIAPLRL